MSRPTIRLATAHLSPHLFDPVATTALITRTIAHAARQNTTLIAFPESFLPGFPIHSALLPPAHHSTSKLFAAFARASVYSDGPEIQAIADAAREGRISVSLGISEKARWSEGTLWNSNVLIDEEGVVRVVHRKLVPTFYERLSWGSGDGEGLRVVDVATKEVSGSAEEARTSAGGGGVAGHTHAGQRMRVGTLICGENTNPLARYTMMSQGQDVHISSWPAIWPTKMPTMDSPQQTTTYSDGESTTTSAQQQQQPTNKNYNNLLANRIRASAHCFEAKCHGIMTAAAFNESNISTLLSFLPQASEHAAFAHALRASPRAASMFLDATGTPIEGFTVDEATGEKTGREMLHEDEEGVLFADITLGEGTLEGKMLHDVTGGYQRSDVFELRVRRGRRGPVTFLDSAEGGGVNNDTSSRNGGGDAGAEKGWDVVR